MPSILFPQMNNFQPDTRYTQLDTLNPILDTRNPILTTRYSQLDTRNSIFSTRYSQPDTRNLILATSHARHLDHLPHPHQTAAEVFPQQQRPLVPAWAGE